MNTSDNVSFAPARLVTENAWRSHLENYELTLLAKLRQRLAGEIPDLAEKFTAARPNTSAIAAATEQTASISFCKSRPSASI